jgi:hypothetical protein
VGVEAAAVLVPLNGSCYQSGGGRGEGMAGRLHAMAPRWAAALCGAAACGKRQRSSAGMRRERGGERGSA